VFDDVAFYFVAIIILGVICIPLTLIHFLPWLWRTVRAPKHDAALDLYAHRPDFQ
jgi:hypothetical protein